MPIKIDVDMCCLCGGCLDVCPSDALVLSGSEIQVIAEQCSGCGSCVEECPNGALSLPA